MKGIIYIRVSSDEQVKGTSLDDQESRCRKYCNENNIEVLRVFREEGASAKTADRKVLLESLEFCRRNKGKVASFVVWKVDRFARNTEDHFAVRKILLDYGVSLQSATEMIGQNPAEKLFETMLAGFAEFDNAVRKQRCSNGMLARLRQGIYPWKPPIGYKPLGAKKRGEKKTEPDPRDEVAFPIIQRGLKEFADGKFASQVEFAKTMDSWGLREARGKKTTPQMAFMILSRYLNFYAGILIDPETCEEILGLHEPMITKEDIYRIKLVLSGKGRITGYDRYNPDFPLRRTITCAHCGGWLTGSAPRGNGGSYFYYHCINKDCSHYGKGNAKKDVEAAFIKYLEKITPKAKLLEVFEKSVIREWEDKGRSFNLDAEKYEKLLAALTLKKSKIRDLLEGGIYSPEDGRERLASVENQIIATKVSLSESRIEQFDVEAAVTYATNFIQNLGRQWFDLSPRLRPRFQKLLFPEGIPYSRLTGFGTAKLGLIYEINHQTSGDLSQVVDPTGFEPVTSTLQMWRSTN
jgi:site-specific DNA recombinase